MCSMDGWGREGLRGSPEILVFGSPWCVESNFHCLGGAYGMTGPWEGCALSRALLSEQGLGLGLADLVVVRLEAVDQESPSIAPQ